MKKQTYFRIIRLFVSLILIIYLYKSIDFEQLKNIFFKIDLNLLIYLFCLLFLNTLISSYKWQLLLKSDSIHVPLKELFVTYLIGSFFNIFLPSNIGGDFYRIYNISRYSLKSAKSFASVFADRFSGFFALVSLNLIFSIYGFSLLLDYRFILIPFVIILFFISVIYILYHQDLLNWILKTTQLNRIKKVNELIGKFLDSIHTYANNRGLILKILGLSFLFQGIAVFFVYILSLSLSLKMAIIYFYIFIPLISIIEALPISIYGLGVRDAAYVFFFSQVGLSSTQALSISLLYVAVTVVYSLIGGIIFAFKTESFRHKKRE